MTKSNKEKEKKTSLKKHSITTKIFSLRKTEQI